MAVAAQEARKYPARKVAQYSKVISLFEKYDVMALARLTKVRSTQIMEIRRSMRDRLELLVVKNKIASKALGTAQKKNAGAVVDSLGGQNLYIFTNMNPFKLNLMLDRNKVYLPAKAGDVATDQITIPAGNTGIPPGPVLSEFKDCKVITKIEGGSIWVTKDTVVAEKEGVINPRLASLLSKLGVKPIKAGLSLNLVYWNGLLLASKDISIDLLQYTNDLVRGAHDAMSLAHSAGYPASKEITTMLVVESIGKALAVAAKAGYVTKDTAELILKDAELKAYRILDLAKQKGYQEKA
ncbi:MAG: 50S ribosomal protein L10 [Nitrososphaerota archaeon]|nr:50S ribosomal protein L10 [Nitrososphaerota archaeon]